MKLSAPRQVSFLIAAALYVLALVSHFDVVHVSREITTYSWIVGYGLLLVACYFRGL